MEISCMEKQGILGMVEHEGIEIADISPRSAVLHGVNTT